MGARETAADGEGAAGLTAAEAARLLRVHGPNELRRDAGTPVWRLIVAQFTSPVVGLLVAACVVAAVLADIVDAAAIGAIVVLNAIVGFLQEHRAERAILALRAMTAPRARVIRDGAGAVVPAAAVVPGDILVFEAGALTGESAPVDKRPGPAPSGAPLAERSDRVFMGTHVVRGTGRARVVATGMRTELGRIADMIASVPHEATPLQAQLARVSRALMLACGAIVVAVAVIGVLRGVSALEVFVSAVSLAVAAVPEGLPAVVTIALAVGVQRMAARHALVRRLPAVETLGCATVICTDKTGTLTTGVMTVRALWGPDEARLVAAAAACCDAELAADEHDGVGDPTEVAILSAAAARGIRRADIERDNPREVVHPFDAERKRMSILRADGVLYAKGAVEVMLARCAEAPAGAAEAAAELAARGLRVLAVAVGTGPEEHGLKFIGLLGISDPPRREAIEAIAQARAAGIRTVMITGDHPVTARAIARELGLLTAGEREDEVVHARASPEDKLRIVRDWKTRGAVVAMTGDGVNDAPALREAHIGVAMGKTGTEVTREAADIVLADDNFATIVTAVREGRAIFDNIRKTLVYLLGGNAAELALMLLAALLGLPLPLLPLQLLWINLVTDGLPALALVVDPVDARVLERPPRPVSEPMLGAREWRHVLVVGALQTAVALSVFVWAIEARGLEQARSLAFTTLVFGELLRAFAARSRERLLWEVGAWTNLRLLAVVAASIALQIGIHHVPVVRQALRLGEMSPADWALSFALGLVPVTTIELAKLLRRKRSAA